MKVKIPVPGVILISEETQFEIAYAFMRLQEFYECSDISRQGKFFTHDEIIEYDAAKSKLTQFKYLERWAGFNVDGETIEKFIKLYKHDFSTREEKLFTTVRNTLEQEEYSTYEGKYYLIGTCSDLYVDHELCHAIFYLYPKFKKESLKLVKSLRKEQYNAVKDMLLKAGYATNVIDDEINAYIATSDMYYIKESVFEELSQANMKNFNWDKIYQLVKNYWEFKEEIELPEDEQLILLD